MSGFIADLSILKRKAKTEDMCVLCLRPPPVGIPRTQPPSSTLASSPADVKAMARSRLKDNARARALKDGELDDLLDVIFAIAGDEAMKHLKKLLDQLRRGGLNSLLTLPSADDLESVRLARGAGSPQPRPVRGRLLLPRLPRRQPAQVQESGGHRLPPESARRALMLL